MNVTKLSLALIATLAITALSGCTSQGTTQDQPAEPQAEPTLEERITALEQTVNGPSDISNIVLDGRIFELENKVGTTTTVTSAYPAGCGSEVGYSRTTGVKCDSTVTTSTTTTTLTFPPAPDGVAHFEVEATWDNCPDGSSGRFYSAPNGVGTFGLEWYVNTGFNRVVMNYGGQTVSGEKTIETHGTWQSVTVSPDAFYFCFYSETDMSVPIALALPPPQKG